MNSIIIIGASAKREKFSNKCIRAYLKLGWTVYPVNPNEQEIEGLKCYSSIKGVPVKPELVTIYLPSKITGKLIPELKKSGIKELILNPGAESDSLVASLKEAGINPLLVCTIRLQGLSPDDF